MARGSSFPLQLQSTDYFSTRSNFPNKTAREYSSIISSGCTQAQPLCLCIGLRQRSLAEKQVMAGSGKLSSATSKDSPSTVNLIPTRPRKVPESGGDECQGFAGRRRIETAARCQSAEGAEIKRVSETNRLFIFGFGYTSCALATDLLQRNWQIAGTCRNSEDRAILGSCGFKVFLFNSDNDGDELKDGGLQELQEATHWLVSVPPVADFDKDPVLAVHVQNLREAAAKGNVKWIGYLSSTGVYGDWQGEWVDENSEPHPSEQKAVARLAAEKDWLSFGRDNSVAVHVFRLGGIYGAGRSALNSILQNRGLTGLERERRRFISRIHVTDICQVLRVSMENPCPGAIYNVVDDDPASRREVFAFASKLLGDKVTAIRPTEEAAHSGDVSTRRIYATQCDEKRVSNRRIKEELQIQLLHPSYKSGLRAILGNTHLTDTSIA